MKSNLYAHLMSLALLVLTAGSALAQSGFFQPLNTSQMRVDAAMTKNINKLTFYTLKQSELRTYLATAPLEFTQAAQPLSLQMPLPNGKTETFMMVESPILAPAIAAKHPEIKTYSGKSSTDPTHTIRISFTASGFNAIILGVENDAAYYDKVSTNPKDQIYRVYFARDAQRPKPAKTAGPGGKCGAIDNPLKLNLPKPNANSGARTAAGPNDVGTSLRTFRLAMAADGEFTQQAVYGGDVSKAYDGLVGYVNRVNAVYRRELSVALQLVSDVSLVYSNTATDPYTNSDQSAMLDQNQTNLDDPAVFGNAKYDIGHVLGAVGGSGGGIALRPSVCDPTTKAGGVSGVGDGSFASVFDDQLVAHEMGHQFNMSHSYNSIVPVCTTREPSTSVEPGAGATIMSYGFTCDASGNDDNYEQPAYAPFLNFHTVSYDQATTYISPLTCFSATATGNAIPAINSISTNTTIPKSTPFSLSGVASDANAGDVLTYSWEGTNIGTEMPTFTTLLDPTKAPFFRSYEPVSTGVRTFPRLTAILDGSNTARGDKLPSVGVVTTHRLTVRDNAGGVTYGVISVTVDGSSGPFLETTNLGGSYAGNSMQTITWSVNNTTAPPVSCASVDILLSTDGGVTFPTVLVAGTPNDGSQSVTLPAVLTGSARIKVAAHDNIFFDISNTDFSITAAVCSVSIAAVPSLTINAGESVILTASGTDSYAWSNAQSTTAITVSPATTTTYSVTGTTGGCTSTTSVTVTVRTCLATLMASTGSACVNSAISLTAAMSGAVSYTWAAPAGAILSSPATGPVVSATLTGVGMQTFTVTVADGSGCRSTTTVTVNSTAVPNAPALTATSRVLNSSSTPVPLTNFVTATSGNTLRFFGTGGSEISPQTASIATAGVQNYSATQSSGPGCQSLPTPFSLTVLEGITVVQPASQTVCRSSSVVLTTVTPGTRYEWYKNGQSAPFKLTEIASIQRGTKTASLTLVSTQTTASYYVKVFQANGSFTFEGPFTVAVNYGCIAPGARQAAESLAEVPLSVVLMPNPVVDGQLRAVITGAAGTPLSVQLLNLRGQIVREQNWPVSDGDQVLEWSIGSQPSGLYLLHAQTPNQLKTVKVIKQ